MLLPIMFLFYVQPAELSSLRIWGGRDAEPNEFPYVVAIEFRIKRKKSTETFIPHCTGSLIAPSWTLTAGHCVNINRSKKNKTVITYTMDGKKTRYNVLYMIAHQNMIINKKYIANDIGLMKNEEVKHVTYAKLSAVDYTTFIGLEALSVGYGLMNTDNGLEDASSGNNTLQILEVMFTKCIDRDRYGSMPAMCTTPKCGAKSSLCPGDSGGPIIHKSGVVAVHSTGANCRSPYYSPRQFRRNLGVAVPVSPFFSWILEQMRLL